jgi:hypothetical protein
MLRNTHKLSLHAGFSWIATTSFIPSVQYGDRIVKATRPPYSTVLPPPTFQLHVAGKGMKWARFGSVPPVQRLEFQYWMSALGSRTSPYGCISRRSNSGGLSRAPRVRQKRDAIHLQTRFSLLIIPASISRSWAFKSGICLQ